MFISTRNYLSMTQLRRVMQDTGCTARQVLSRTRTAIRFGIDVRYFIAQELYRLTGKQLAYYLTKSKARKYVENLKKTTDLSDYEIYRQMTRAISEYGISCATFCEKKLLNASDEQLLEVGAEIRKKNARAYSKIAEALHISEDEAKELAQGIRRKYGYSVRETYTNRLYLLSDEEIAALRSERDNRKKARVGKVAEKTGWSESQIMNHINHCYIDFGIVPDVYYCSRFYEFDDYQLALCGNSTDSKKLCAKYNKGIRVLSNKRLFNDKYRDFIGRRFWVNRNTDFEKFKEFACGLNDVFCKPTDSTSGRGAYRYSLQGKDLKEVYEFFMDQPEYLVEEALVQHEDMARFYPGSVNTIRLISIMKDGEFDAFACIARFGVDGVTDNFSGGGIACSVDPKTGVILTDGLVKTGEVHERHPVTGERFKGFQIPHWPEVLRVAEAILGHVDSINYAGLDLAICDDGVVIIEGNASPSFSGLQAAALLRGEYLKPLYFKYLFDDADDSLLENAAQTVKACGGSFDDAVDKLVRADIDKERVGHREQIALPSVLQNNSIQWLKRRNEEPVFS